MQALQNLIAWTPLGLPAFLFVITLVVFFHELGHFLVARACGVKVDVFSIGFGKEIVGFNDKSGTRWKLSWIPVGGYVKFAGDANAASMPDAQAAAAMSDADRSKVLFFKPLWQRALVAAAGPIANFLLAIVLFTGLNLHTGHIVRAPVIGDVVQDSAAQAAGIKPGDLVTAIDGSAINDFEQLPEVISVSGGRTLKMDLMRAGKPLTVWVTPRTMKIRDTLGDLSNSIVIGVRASATAAVTRVTYGPGGAVMAACATSWDIARTTVQGIAQMVRGYASADQFRGLMAIAKPTDGHPLDGRKAHQWHLVPNATDAKLPPLLRSQRNDLELAVEQLRDRKEELPFEEYQSQLERLLVALAELNERIEQ